MSASHDITYFARGWAASQKDGRIGLTQPDRRYHFLTTGRTGTGKSTMLAHMIVQDLAAGRGLALLDPHGDLAEAVLPFVPKERQQDLVYLNPADLDYPIGLNVLQDGWAGTAPRHLVGDNLMTIFHKMFADSWGNRMAHLLHNTLLTLLENPGSTLLGITRLLTDNRFRATMVKRVSDPLVRNYWEREFVGFSERLRAEVVSPVLNKVGAFLTNQALRNILGLYPTKVRNRPYDFHIFLHKKGCIIYGISFLIMQQIFATKSFTRIRHGVSCRKYFNLCNREKIYATNEDSEHF